METETEGPIDKSSTPASSPEWKMSESPKLSFSPQASEEVERSQGPKSGIAGRGGSPRKNDSGPAAGRGLDSGAKSSSKRSDGTKCVDGSRSSKGPIKGSGLKPDSSGGRTPKPISNASLEADRSGGQVNKKAGRFLKSAYMERSKRTDLENNTALLRNGQKLNQFFSQSQPFSFVAATRADSKFPCYFLTNGLSEMAGLLSLRNPYFFLRSSSFVLCYREPKRGREPGRCCEQSEEDDCMFDYPRHNHGCWVDHLRCSRHQYICKEPHISSCERPPIELHNSLTDGRVTKRSKGNNEGLTINLFIVLERELDSYTVFFSHHPLSNKVSILHSEDISLGDPGRRSQ